MFNKTTYFIFIFFFNLQLMSNVFSLNKSFDKNDVDTNRFLSVYFLVEEKEFSFFESNNFTIFFKFVDIDLNSFLHVDVICSNYIHLKQRFCLERISVSLLINQNVVFDEKLNKLDLLSRKNLRENETNTKVFEKKMRFEKMTFEITT